MLLCIGSVLSSDELKEIQSLFRHQPFIDGRKTAGWAAAAVKNNMQMDSSSPGYKRLQELVMTALSGNELFTLAAMPRSVRPLLFSQYSEGMGYGNHVDNAVMGASPAMRSDVSFTVFLNDPDEYKGGELVMEDLSDTREFKLPAGSVVLYPSSYLHRVETVTSGTRKVAVGWLQSYIRSGDQRKIIFELETLKKQIFDAEGKSTKFDTLSVSTSNLWRMWADI